MSEHGAQTGGFDWEGAEDLTALSREEPIERGSTGWWKRSES
jgi:hypothetical protein